MKLSLQISLLVGACAVLPMTGLFAQEPIPAATPSVSEPSAGAPGARPADGGNGGRERMRAAMASLTPAERQELRAARDKAKQDPAVEEAMKNRESDPKTFRRTMHQAVLKADPNVKAILEKMRANHVHRKDFQTN